MAQGGPSSEQADPSLAALEQGGSSVRSNWSGMLVGSFLGGSRLQVPPEAARQTEPSESSSLLSTESDPEDTESAMMQGPVSAVPAMSSMGNASGYGTMRPGVSEGTAIEPRAYGGGGGEHAPSPLPPLADHTYTPEESRKVLDRELRILTRFTFPVWATHLLELSLSIVSVLSLGHLGTVELAASSMAGMTANVTGFSIISGLVCALDTLLPASYTRHPKMMGIWTQRVGVIIAFVIPLIVTLWVNADKVLLLFVKDAEIAHKARLFLSVLAIGLPGHALFELSRRFLQAQGLMHAPTVVLFVVSPLNALANYLLVWGPKWMRFGFLGAPLASAISMWLMAILCCLQCSLVAGHTWSGWSWRAWDLDGLKKCASLGLAGLLGLATEWWAWEIVGLVTAALGTAALAAQSVLLITSSVTYQLPYGAAVAASVRVGNLLGLGQVADARLACRGALIISIVVGLFDSGLVYFARNQWGYLFSSDPKVVELIASVLPIMAIFQCADSVCGIAAGILRGCGCQAVGAAINVTAYYVVGIPAALFLAFGPFQLGLHGLWWGLTIALIYGACTAVWFIMRMDWSSVVRRIHHTMSEAAGEEA